MPKEIFKYKHDGHYIVGETAGEEVNLKLAWSKPEGDTLGAVLLQVGDGQGGFGPSQIIGDTENVEQMDRLIAALKRARRAVLGRSTFVDKRLDGVGDWESALDRE